MPQFIGLRLEIALIMGIGLDRQRDPLHDLQAVPLQSRHFLGVVGHKADLFQSQVGHNLRPDPVIAQIGFEPQHLIRLHGVCALLLEFIGADLVQQPDAAPLLFQIDQRSPARLRDLLHRQMQLTAAVAAPPPG
jgi:hypothetical protein